MAACAIDQDLLVNFIEVEEEVQPLPKNMNGLDILPEIYDIDYLCEAKYRGQLQGQYRHGIGAIQYSANEEPIIGYWKDNKCIDKDGVEHPTRELVAIAVQPYEGRKRRNAN